MDQQTREQAFVNALATEHFVLQAARSAIVGEQVGRGSIYLGAVSSALIALGFLAQVVTRLELFVAAVLPALFVLGEFTFAALLRNTMENLVLLGQMQRIRGYYRAWSPRPACSSTRPRPMRSTRRRWPPSGCGPRQRRRCSPAPAWSLPSTASWAASGWRCWSGDSVSWVMERR
jgi:hypothetical protein